MLHIPGLFIAPSKNKGRGVFTSHNLLVEDVIEICPVIVIPPEQVELIDKTILYNYYFLWTSPENSICIALGYGSIYNHSKTPNAEAIADTANNSFTFKCIKNITAGEEIFIDYNGTGKNSLKLWFEPL